MPKLIRFDWAMKSILRNKANFDVLEAFLTNLLKEEITVQELLESESNSETAQSKFNRVDLKCVDSKGRQIIIEIQTQREIDYLFRIVWGASKALVESVNIGERYAAAVKVISISILYHTPPPVPSNKDFIYYGKTQLIGLHTNEPLQIYALEEQQIDTKTCNQNESSKTNAINKTVFTENKNSVTTTDRIFPEYYLIFVEKFEDAINEDLDEWIYFFKHQEIKSTFKSKGIHLLSKKLDRLLMSKEEGQAYDRYIDHTSRDDNMLLDAKAEGEAIGLAKGRAEGLAEGESQGKLAVARKLLAKGLDLESVAEVSGISKEILQTLK